MATIYMKNLLIYYLRRKILQMPLNRQLKFIVLFSALLLIEFVCGSLENLYPWRWLTKPSLVIALIIYFYCESKSLPRATRRLTIMALIFSLAGDIFLLFVSNADYFFSLGLLSFLLAHIFYCMTFLQRRNPESRPVALGFLLVAYAFLLFYMLHEVLGALLIPVFIYMIVILMMVMTAFLRRGKVQRKSFNLVFIGALFFVVSDSILAVNKFYVPLTYSHISIMASYALAQLFIVMGVLKSR